MDEAVEGGKELLSETVQAFKTGLRGEEYIPGSGGSPGLKRDEEIAKLDDLRASGTLTEEEYLAARARVMESEA
ncbi:MAG TPA: SHOCT domain-containing protein [Chloroflexota bacterium]